MAIIFLKELSETKVLNAFNNNVISFISDIGKTALKATLTIQGEPFEITPSPDGVFQYNFKEIVKKNINQNYFKDTIVPDIKTSYVYLDETVFKNISVDITIEFNDLTFDNIYKSYNFLKSVEQLEERKKGLTIDKNTSITILTPFTSNSNKTYQLTYFEGYPFDVSIYSNDNREIEINNKKTLQKTTISLNKGVNRLFISDGDNNFSFEDKMALYLGVNELEFKVSEKDFVTLFLKKKDSDCGVYLKWFNNYGGWNYYLFKSLSDTRKMKSIGALNRDFENLEDLFELETEMGIESQDVIDFYAVNLEHYEKYIVNGITESPKINRYINCMFQKSEGVDWVSERIAFSSIVLKNTKNKLYRALFSLNKTARNTMKL